MTTYFAWEFLWVVGLAVLAIAIAWASFAYRSRNRANTAISEEAARLLREHGGERYEREDKPRLNAKVARNEEQAAHHE